MTITIPTLPIPLIGAIVMTWLGLRAWRAGRSGPLFLSLIAICAWQSAVIALHHHHGLLWLRGVQPVGAALIPPLAWLALQDSGIRAVRPRDAVHLWPPITVLVALALWPLAIDAIILLAFLGYGAAILIVLRHGSDALPRSRLQGGDHAARLWRLIGAGLILSSLSELLIIAAFTSGHSGWVGWIIGGYSAGSLLAIGVLSLSTALTAVSTPNTEHRTPKRRTPKPRRATARHWTAPNKQLTTRPLWPGCTICWRANRCITILT